MGATQHRPGNSLDSRRRKGCALHCLPGLMLLLPMPEKLPPPHPLLLACERLLTPSSTGMWEGVYPKPSPAPPPSGASTAPGPEPRRGCPGRRAALRGGEWDTLFFPPSLKNKVPPAHLRSCAAQLEAHELPDRVRTQLPASRAPYLYPFLHPLLPSPFQTGPTKLPQTQHRAQEQQTADNRTQLRQRLKEILETLPSLQSSALCVWVPTCPRAELREATLAHRHPCKLSGMRFQKTFENRLLFVLRSCDNTFLDYSSDR